MVTIFATTFLFQVNCLYHVSFKIPVSSFFTFVMLLVMYMSVTQMERFDTVHEISGHLGLKKYEAHAFDKTEWKSGLFLTES